MLVTDKSYYRSGDERRLWFALVSFLRFHDVHFREFQLICGARKNLFIAIPFQKNEALTEKSTLVSAYPIL